jgi:hypothetical protein
VEKYIYTYSAGVPYIHIFSEYLLVMVLQVSVVETCGKQVSCGPRVYLSIPQNIANDSLLFKEAGKSCRRVFEKCLLNIPCNFSVCFHTTPNKWLRNVRIQYGPMTVCCRPVDTTSKYLAAGI